MTRLSEANGWTEDEWKMHVLRLARADFYFVLDYLCGDNESARRRLSENIERISDVLGDR